MDITLGQPLSQLSAWRRGPLSLGALNAYPGIKRRVLVEIPRSAVAFLFSWNLRPPDHVLVAVAVSLNLKPEFRQLLEVIEQADGLVTNRAVGRELSAINRLIVGDFGFAAPGAVQRSKLAGVESGGDGSGAPEVEQG